MRQNTASFPRSLQGPRRTSLSTAKTCAICCLRRGTSLADLPPEQQRQITDIDAILAAHPNDIAARVAKAVRCERFGLLADAVEQFQEVERLAGAAVWTMAASQNVVAKAKPKQPSRAVGGATYAVVVGANRYPLLSSSQQLEFAQNDAQEFYNHLTGPRGGVSPENVQLLLGKSATFAAIRTAIQSAFSRAQQNDVVALYVAAHGMAPEQDDGISDAYLLGYDSNPENLGATAVRMSEVQAYMHGLSKAREIRLFIDACKSGRIGSIKSKSFSAKVDRQIRTSPARVLALLATRSSEVSFECENYAHGAFTYYVLRGLETEEATDGAGRVTADSLSHYVVEKVRSATATAQTPVPNANLPHNLVLRFDSEQPPSLSFPAISPGVCQNARGRSPSAEPEPEPGPTPETPFERALRAGRIRPSQPDNAFTLLESLKSGIAAQDYGILANRLRISLEDAGQRVILEYLKGDAIAPNPAMFERGAEFFHAAHQLAPDDDLLLAKELFCKGRVLVFAHKFDQALESLEQSIRLDPVASYAYNAIGLAYLQKARYSEAEGAFLDAIRFAPYWATRGTIWRLPIANAVNSGVLSNNMTARFR